MRRSKIFVFICTALFSITLKAQIVEIGVLGGGSNYIGDLSDESMVMSSFRPAAGVFGRYNINNRWALKGFGGYGTITGDDKKSSKPVSKLRNLSFYSDVYEFSLQFELNLLKNDITNITSRPFIPYLFGGVGVFHFNPKADLNGVSYELQPFGTEGQGSTVYNDLKKYNLTEICIPIGLGFRQRVGENFYFGLEAGYRYTTTNYLDDVGGVYADNTVVFSHSGENGADLADRSWEVGNTIPFPEGAKRSDKSMFPDDLYFFTGLTISYIIRYKGQNCPTFM